MNYITNGNLFAIAKKINENKNAPGKFNVYFGRLNGEIVYVGTTVQKPADRFRWHKANGKKFAFEVVKQCDTEDEMLDLEFEMIKKHKPKFNKITHRQNLNVRLDQATLDLRKNDPQWCKSCLKRRVNRGYSKCYYCSRP
jgi:hypothetical protein